MLASTQTSPHRISVQPRTAEQSSSRGRTCPTEDSEPGSDLTEGSEPGRDTPRRTASEWDRPHGGQREEGTDPTEDSELGRDTPWKTASRGDRPHGRQRAAGGTDSTEDSEPGAQTPRRTASRGERPYGGQRGGGTDPTEDSKPGRETPRRTASQGEIHHRGQQAEGTDPTEDRQPAMAREAETGVAGPLKVLPPSAGEQGVGGGGQWLSPPALGELELHPELLPKLTHSHVCGASLESSCVLSDTDVAACSPLPLLWPQRAPDITVGTTAGPEDHHQLAGHSTLVCGEQLGALWRSMSCDWELCLRHFANTNMNGHPVNTSS
ncbi:hypothetical protein H8959_014239 [Pygathrix nigripes]